MNLKPNMVDKMEMGMTLQQICAIIGCPPSYIQTMNGHHSRRGYYWYDSDGDRIRVDLDKKDRINEIQKSFTPWGDAD